MKSIQFQTTRQTFHFSPCVNLWLDFSHGVLAQPPAMFSSENMIPFKYGAVEFIRRLFLDFESPDDTGDTRSKAEKRLNARMTASTLRLITAEEATAATPDASNSHGS